MTKSLTDGQSLSRGPIRIEVVGPREWDDFLTTAEASSPFHNNAWLRALEQQSGLEVLRIIGFQGFEAKLGLPAFVRRRGLIPVFYSPPPGHGIPYLGPIFHGISKLKESTRRALFRDWVEALRRQWFRSRTSVVRINHGPWINDVRAYLDRGFAVIPHYAYCLRFSGDAGARSNVKPGEGSTLLSRVSRSNSVREGRMHDIRNLVEVQGPGMRIGGRNHSERLEIVQEVIGQLPLDSVRTILWERDPRQRVGAICLGDRTRLYLWKTVPRLAAFDRLTGELVLADMLLWAREHGYQQVTMFGSDDHGVAQLQAAFNPALECSMTARLNLRGLGLLLHHSERGKANHEG